MSLKIEMGNPKTQSIDAVKALLTWRGRAVDPLPQYVELGSKEGRCVLVLSNKKDCFYVTTARACSCPAAVYNHGPCKHQRKHFAEQIAKPKPAGKWHGQNGPWIEEVPVKASSPLLQSIVTIPPTGTRHTSASNLIAKCGPLRRLEYVCSLVDV